MDMQTTAAVKPGAKINNKIKSGGSKAFDVFNIVLMCLIIAIVIGSISDKD